MNHESTYSDDFELDVDALGVLGEIEYEELDDDDTALEVDRLMAAFRGARSSSM